MATLVHRLTATLAVKLDHVRDGTHPTLAMELMARRILCKVTKAPKIFEHAAHLFRSCLAC